MFANFAAIDPGFTGAIAIFSPDPIVFDMPLRVWEGHKEVDVLSLMGIVKQALPETLFALEWSPTRPGHNPQHVLRFGIEMGQCEATVIHAGFVCRRLTPQCWKGFLGLSGKADDPSSAQGVKLWVQLYPKWERLLYGPRGGILDGRLDSLLMAHFLKTTETSPVGAKGGKRPPRMRGFTKKEIQNG
jgi:hypothetical protein